METVRGAQRKLFSRIGWGFAALLLSTVLLQLVGAMLVGWFAPEFMQSPWYIWVLGSLPMYCVGVPICALIIGRAPRVYIYNKPAGFGMVTGCFAVSYTVLYAGNIVGVGINGLLGLLKGEAVTSPVDSLLTGQSLWLVFLFAVVIGPVLEEVLCRKLIIDRLAPFGDRAAIFVSALVFGLMHGNFSQFFYAFGIGLIFGYLYIRSGRLRYTIGLHMLINFMGSVLPIMLLNGVDMDAFVAFAENPADLREALYLLPQAIALLGYVLLAMLLWVSGLVLFFVFRRRIHLNPGEHSLKGRRFKTVVLNSGMLVFFAAVLGLFVLNILL